MIEVLAESNAQVLVVKAFGKLTHNDYEAVFIPELQQRIDVNGSARVLLVLEQGFSGWELEAAWDDAKFGIQHRNDFTRLAMIGAPEWANWSVKIAAHFMSGEVRMFTDKQFDEALHWVSS